MQPEAQMTGLGIQSEDAWNEVVGGISPADVVRTGNLTGLASAYFATQISRNTPEPPACYW
jgi:hypothetical protein